MVGLASAAMSGSIPDLVLVLMTCTSVGPLLTNECHCWLFIMSSSIQTVRAFITLGGNTAIIDRLYGQTVYHYFTPEGVYLWSERAWYTPLDGMILLAEDFPLNKVTTIGWGCDLILKLGESPVLKYTHPDGDVDVFKIESDGSQGEHIITHYADGFRPSV